MFVQLLSKSHCKVEERRGCLGHTATLRFLSSLIEPDRPSYGIRLSDKTSGLRTRGTMSKGPQLHETQRVMEILVREASCSRISDLVLVA